MNADDLLANYFDHGLATAEEREDWEHNSADDAVRTTPSWWRERLMACPPLPEALTRREFEARRPALGLTTAQVDDLETHAKNPLLHPAQLRSLFRMVRSTMCRNLIPTPGCSTVAELCSILRDEIASKVPARVPDWYVFSTVTMGPRKIGYDVCSARGCLQTETLDKRFLKCGQCRLPLYCSKDCQKNDWKVRHKKVCREIAEQRKKVKSAGKILQLMSGVSRAELKAEKRRGRPKKKKKKKKKK